MQRRVNFLFLYKITFIISDNVSCCVIASSSCNTDLGWSTWLCFKVCVQLFIHQSELLLKHSTHTISRHTESIVAYIVMTPLWLIFNLFIYLFGSGLPITGWKLLGKRKDCGNYSSLKSKILSVLICDCK